MARTHKAGRPPKLADPKQVAVRVPNALLERIDKYTHVLRVVTEDETITRGDAIRELIEKGLAATEPRTEREAPNA